MRYAENELDRYETQLRYARQAEEKAEDYRDKAEDALDRID